MKYTKKYISILCNIQMDLMLNIIQEGSKKYLQKIENIEHLCETKYGCSGSPLINYNNNKVLGFHKGKEEKEDWNVGTYIKGPLEKFYEKNKN